MNSPSLVDFWDFAALSMIALANFILIGVFLYAYSKRRLGVYLILATASLIFFLLNSHSAVLQWMYLSRTMLLSRFAKHLFDVLHDIGIGIAPILWLYGMIVLVRLSLENHSTDQNPPPLPPK
jgi:hypothetical protein